MAIEYIGGKIFLEEVEAAGKVWVAKGTYNNVYAMELDGTGFSLPVWSNRERVVDYLKNARLVGTKYEPHSVPVDVFANTWLSDKTRDISELLINPDGKATRVLVYTAEEFQETQSVT